MHREPAGVVPGAQARGEIAVELDHMQVWNAFKQRAGERTKPRTDFDHRLTGLWMKGVENAPDHAAVMQKILAEAFARAMLRHKYRNSNHGGRGVGAGCPWRQPEQS